MHARHEQGRFSTNPQHLAKEKISGIERGVSYLSRKRRQEQEEQKRTRLAEQIMLWQKARDIRAYLEAVRQSLTNGKMKIANPDAFEEWMIGQPGTQIMSIHWLQLLTALNRF